MTREHENERGHGGGHHDGGGHQKPPQSYRILIDLKPHEWPKPVITGTEIKRLADVDQQTYDAWLDVPGPDDKQVSDEEKVDLTQKGVEKFFTIKKTTTEG